MSLAAADRIGAIQTAIQQLAQPPVPTDAARATTAAVPGGAISAASPAAGASAGAADFASVLQQTLRGAASDGAVTGSDIVAQARQYLGVPYVFGGEDETGMDCSGLVQRVLADLGIDAPRVVQDQADIGVEVPSLDQAQPGDLLVTQGEGHIVIYAGDGKIIHAPRPGKDVQLVDNYLSPSEISTIRRVVPADTGTTTVAATAGTAAEISPAQLLTALQTLFLSQAGELGTPPTAPATDLARVAGALSSEGIA